MVALNLHTDPHIVQWESSIHPLLIQLFCTVGKPLKPLRDAKECVAAQLDGDTSPRWAPLKAQ